mmetsp:Transcript_29091/g.65875  ORF Transcript_29091/g.65875 Transcript_29091/m.65875 type:complete len:166 (+) Transcript_29091:14-511(+)
MSAAVIAFIHHRNHAARMAAAREPVHSASQRHEAARKNLRPAAFENLPAESSAFRRLISTSSDLSVGEVLAFGAGDGANGTFKPGDVGTGRHLRDGRVVIVWSNMTQTFTSWPNPSWYRGNPLPCLDLELSTACGDGTISDFLSFRDDASIVFEVESIRLEGQAH